jgi:hypothetical protein
MCGAAGDSASLSVKAIGIVDLAIDRFRADEALRDIERRCRCTACGWRRADLGPDYSRQQLSLYGGGWMMLPG